MYPKIRHQNWQTHDFKDYFSHKARKNDLIIFFRPNFPGFNPFQVSLEVKKAFPS